MGSKSIKNSSDTMSFSSLIDIESVKEPEPVTCDMTEGASKKTSYSIYHDDNRKSNESDNTNKCNTNADAYDYEHIFTETDKNVNTQVDTIVDRQADTKQADSDTQAIVNVNMHNNANSNTNSDMKILNNLAVNNATNMKECYFQDEFSFISINNPILFMHTKYLLRYIDIVTYAYAICILEKYVIPEKDIKGTMLIAVSLSDKFLHDRSKIFKLYNKAVHES